MQSVALLLGCALFHYPLEASAQKSGGLRLAFIGALSGGAASFGQAARNGLELALKESPAGTVEVKYEDDQFVPSKAVAAFNSVVAGDKAHVVLCLGSAPCNAVAPLAEARKVPLIAWASDPTVSLGRRWVVRAYPSGQEEGQKTLEEAKARGFKDIALLAAIDDYAISWSEGVAKIAPPGLLKMNEQVPPDLTDLSPMLARARQSGVQDFLLCLSPGQAGLFARRAVNFGFKPKIGGCLRLENFTELKLSEGALKDAWYVTIPISDGFKEKYTKVFGPTDAISAAAVYYDLGRILLSLESEKRRGEIVEAIKKKARFAGVAGEITIHSTENETYLNLPLEARLISAVTTQAP